MKQYLNKEFLLNNKKLVLKVTAIIALIVVAFFVFVLREDSKKEEVYISEPSVQTTVTQEEGGETTTEKETSLFVDISGAVKKPMVAELPAGSRVIDAINAAGGLKNGADIESINRAAFVNDGDKITIPMEGEMEIGMEETATLSTEATKGKVNINTATLEELQTLNGVGPVTAEKILAYREKSGPFQKIEDLKEVDGIGDKTFDKLKDEIMI